MAIPPVVARIFSGDSTSPLTREARVMVRGEGWWCGNPSGSRQNFFGRQHLTFDKGGVDVVLSEGWYSNPSVLTAKSLVNKKGGCVAIKMQQDNSLCLAVNPPPFDKGGKGVGAK